MIYLVYSLLTLVCLLIFTAFCLFFYWKFKKQVYTRERFAFVSVSGAISLIISIIPIVVGGNNWINLIIKVLNHLLEWNIQQVNISISDKFLLIIVLAVYLAACLTIFNSWDGKKSVRQHLKEKEREDSSLINDLIALLKKSESLKVFNPIEEQIRFEIKFPIEESFSWHTKAATYLNLLTRQTKINPNKDWHPQESCYISKYSENDNYVAILIAIEQPTEFKIKKFLEYTESYLKKRAFKCYLLIKNGEQNSKIISINNINIETRYESEMLNNLINFNEYKDFIIESIDTKEIITGYGFTIKDIYTPPSCTIKKRLSNGKIEEIKIEDIEEYLYKWINDTTEKKHIALLGEYGQGKSVLALNLCYQIFNGNIKTDRIPIIIELRGKYPRQYSDLIKFFADWGSNFSIDPNALFRLHLAGRLLIIFEGFDEMELVGDYSIRLDHFRKIWEFSYPNSKIIITGRPNYFLNDNELKTILKTTDTHTNLPHCEEIYINMFDKARIKNSLRNADKDVREDILEILSRSDTNKSFIDLISRPALLFLTSIVWKDRKINEFKKNINSAFVIEEFIKQTYERQENKEIKSPLSSIERSYFMLGIAIGMIQLNGYTNQIDLTSLKKIIDNLYNNFPDDLTEINLARGSTNKLKLKERFEERYNEETVFLDIRSCGILVRDLSTFDSYKFAHKSFLEYLVSFFYANLILDFKENENDKIIIRTIKKHLNVNLDKISKTNEVFKFIIQLIAKRINLPDDDIYKLKMKRVFQKVYPYKYISFKAALKLVPFCGRDLKVALIGLIAALTFYLLIALIYSIESGFNFVFSNKFIFSKTSVVTWACCFISFYVLPIYIENQQQKKLAHKSYSKFLFLDSFLNKILIDSKEQIIDPGNLNLWYQTCLEIGIPKEIMKKEIPHRIFEKLDNSYNSINQRT